MTVSSSQPSSDLVADIRNKLEGWPWHPDWWKPTLLAAAADRLEALEAENAQLRADADVARAGGHWCSICSWHQQYNPDCDICHRGSWLPNTPDQIAVRPSPADVELAIDDAFDSLAEDGVVAPKAGDVLAKFPEHERGVVSVGLAEMVTAGKLILDLDHLLSRPPSPTEHP